MAADAPKRVPGPIGKRGAALALEELRPLLAPHLGTVVVAGLCVLGGSAMGLVYPHYFGRAIDAVALHGRGDELGWMTLILVASFVAQGVFVYFRYFLLGWVGERVVAGLRVRIFAHLVGLDVLQHQRQRSGELMSRLSNDISKLKGLVGDNLATAMAAVATLVGGLAVLFALNWKMTLAVLAVIPPIAILGSQWGKRLRRFSRVAQDRLATSAGLAQECLGGVETVQAFGAEEHEAKRYQASVDHTLQSVRRVLSIRSGMTAAMSTIAFVAIGAVFWLGGRLMLAGELTVGQLAEFFFYAAAVAASIAGTATLFSRILDGLGATERVFGLLRLQPGVTGPAEARSMAGLAGEVRFEDVCFTYPERDEPALRGVNLRVSPGETCALVGASGSGKTTIARLLFRFFDPERGRVSIDGLDLCQLDLRELRGHCGFVSQDPVLWSGTLRENIRYARPEASDEDVVAAARSANATEFIESFPDGFDTEIGERGVSLSGGQRQRIAIARAVLRDPKILVLDEATAALDGESEKKVQEALTRLRAGRTTVVIAHRLSAVRSADQIVVIDEGRVVETGTHTQLVGRSGHYSRLIASQTEQTFAVSIGS